MDIILELVDRLVATNNRAAIAEASVAALTDQLNKSTEAVQEATKKLDELNKEISSKDHTITFLYNENQKLEKELKELKGENNDLSA